MERKELRLSLTPCIRLGNLFIHYFSSARPFYASCFRFLVHCNQYLALVRVAIWIKSLWKIGLMYLPKYCTKGYDFSPVLGLILGNVRTRLAQMSDVHAPPVSRYTGPGHNLAVKQREAERRLTKRQAYRIWLIAVSVLCLVVPLVAAEAAVYYENENPGRITILRHARIVKSRAPNKQYKGLASEVARCST